MFVVFKAENVLVRNCTVKEENSQKFECDSGSASPFYYYRYYSTNIHPRVSIGDTKNEYPWAVYTINSCNSLTNLQTIPEFLTTSRHSLTINNITTEYHNNIICCQGYNEKQNDCMVASLSKKTCYHVNVQCKCLYI